MPGVGGSTPAPGALLCSQPVLQQPAECWGCCDCVHVCAGKELRSKGLNRIGNMLVPNSNYCLFEDWIMPLLDQMLKEQQEQGTVWTPSKVRHAAAAAAAGLGNGLCTWQQHPSTSATALRAARVCGGLAVSRRAQLVVTTLQMCCRPACGWVSLSPTCCCVPIGRSLKGLLPPLLLVCRCVVVQIIARLGQAINHPDSVYYWAWKNDIPVFCPAITDGSIGGWAEPACAAVHSAAGRYTGRHLPAGYAWPGSKSR